MKIIIKETFFFSHKLNQYLRHLQKIYHLTQNFHCFFPADFDMLSKIVKGIAYENAKNYFDF